MKRPPLYSRSGPARPRVGAAPVAHSQAGSGGASVGARGAAPRVQPAAATPAAAAAAPSPWRRRLLRFERPLLILAGAVLATGLVALGSRLGPAPQPITQDDIDAAVLETLQTKSLPSPSAKAYEVVAPSVVRVRALGEANEEDKDKERAVGSGVVVLENGTILTNLHVVSEAKRIGVVFADGTESDAVVVSAQPENDLAVLRAQTLPDDLVPATLRGTGDLREGDQVVAVGFPFGIGPSVSSGVISGLRREYRSPEGKRLLTNLIQFDAAANPGSSGGPLVTNEGEVVGIVTAILNPTEQRVFVGIGFAVPIENAAGGIGMSPF